jgi:hypothetical protein
MILLVIVRARAARSDSGLWRKLVGSVTLGEVDGGVDCAED